MVVDGEPGIAGDTKLFGKHLVAVKAGGLFQPPAKDTAAHLLEDLALQRPRCIEIQNHNLPALSMTRF